MRQNYFYTVFFLCCFLPTFAQNNSIHLNGFNYISIPFHSWTSNSSFTFEYDFYINSQQDYNARVSCTNSSQTAAPIDFYVTSSGASVLKLGDGTASETIPGTPSFNAGQWYHVAIAVTNTAVKNVKLYVNGIPTVDYNFTQTLGSSNVNYAAIGSVFTFTNTKFDNFRIWTTTRTATEILNNYNSCLVGNEANLFVYYNFDGLNGKLIKNLATTYGDYYGVLQGNISYTTGTGCTITPAYPPIMVTGIYSGIYYYAGELNGKPQYRTDNINCSTLVNQSNCDYTSGSYHQIFWDGNQWVLLQDDCVWLFTNCLNTVQLDPSPITPLAINAATTAFSPCAGWVFSDTNATGTFSSDNCTLNSYSPILDENIIIYPNPTKGIFTLNTKDDLTLKVYDIVGKLIFNSEVISGTNLIDISNYSNGTYLLQYNTKEGKTNTLKLLKE